VPCTACPPIKGKEPESNELQARVRLSTGDTPCPAAWFRANADPSLPQMLILPFPKPISSSLPLFELAKYVKKGVKIIEEP